MGKAMSSGIPLRNPEHACWQTYWLPTELCHSSVHWTPINIWNLVEISSPFGVQIVREQHWILIEKKGILFQVLNSFKVCVWFCYNSWHVQALSTRVSCSYCDVMFGLLGERISCKNDTFGEFCTLHPPSFALLYTKFFRMGHPPSYLFLYSPSSAIGIHQVMLIVAFTSCVLHIHKVLSLASTKSWHWQATPSRAISSCIMALLKELLQGLQAFFQRDDNPVLWSLEETSNPKESTQRTRQAAVEGTHTRGATDRPYTWLLHGGERFRCIASFLRSNLLLW